MSFSVRDSSLSSKSHSPYVQSYKSPQIAPSAMHGLPPFSLPHTNSDEVPKRTGTDPTKYKTMICRNWELTGSCSFRGCTFAHGVEELRAPVKLDMHSSPSLIPQPASATSTPKLGAQPVRPLMQSKLEYLMEVLYSEVIHTRDLSTVHKEANRTLEGMLRREQQLYEASTAQLEMKRMAASELMTSVAACNAHIVNISDDPVAQALQQRALQLLPAPPIEEPYAFASDVVANDNGIDLPVSLDLTDDAKVEELLRMLKPQSPTRELQDDD